MKSSFIIVDSAEYEWWVLRLPNGVAERGGADPRLWSRRLSFRRDNSFWSFRWNFAVGVRRHSISVHPFHLVVFRSVFAPHWLRVGSHYHAERHSFMKPFRLASHEDFERLGLASDIPVDLDLGKTSGATS